jgi:predicted PurR-regulated permease PerM
MEKQLEILNAKISKNSDKTTEEISVLSERRMPVRVKRMSVALSGLYLLAIFFTLYAARTLFMPIVFAVLLFFIFSPIVRALKKRGLPAGIGAGLIVMAFLGILVYGFYSLAAPAAEWLQNAPRTIGKLESKLRLIKAPVERMKEAIGKVEAMASVREDGQPGQAPVEVKDSNTSGILFVGSQVVQGVAAALVLLYFLLASGDMFLRKIVRAVPRVEDGVRAVSVARQIETDVGRYMLTVSAINAGLGILVGTAMFVLGMPTPALWGLLAGTMAFIPYLGATVSFTVLSVVALLTFDTFGRAALVPAVFLAIDLTIEQFLNPVIVGKSLALNPVVIFCGVLVWGWMWGILGALIAVPILVVVKIFCDRIPRFHYIGEFLGEDSTTLPRKIEAAAS